MTFALEIPVEDRFVGLVRHVAAHAARRARMDEDRIDDLRVAVSEVVSTAVQSRRRAGHGSTIRVEIEIGDPFEIAVTGGAIDGRDAERNGGLLDDGSLGLMITEALVDEVEVEELPSGASRVRLALACPAGGSQ